MAPNRKRATTVENGENIAPIDGTPKKTPIKSPKAKAAPKVLEERNIILEKEVEALTAKLQAATLQNQTLASKLEKTKSKAPQFEPQLPDDVLLPTAEPAAKSKKGEEKKKKRDERAPKHPPTAFILWSNANRDAIASENPGLDFGEMQKKLSEAWAATSVEVRMPFAVKMKQALSQYREEKAAYDLLIQKEAEEKQALGMYSAEREKDVAIQLLQQYREYRTQQLASISAKDAKKAKKAGGGAKPKKPLSAFMFFSMHRRQEMITAGTPKKQATFAAVSKQVGAEWTDMSGELKAPWEQQAEQDRKRYQDEMAVFKAAAAEAAEAQRATASAQQEVAKEEAAKLWEEHQAKEQGLELLKEKMKQIKKDEKEARTAERLAKKEAKDARAAAREGAPKRPLSAYQLWSKEERLTLKAEEPAIAEKEAMKVLGERWKALPEETKEQLKQATAPAWAQYHKEVLLFKAGKVETC